MIYNINFCMGITCTLTLFPKQKIITLMWRKYLLLLAPFPSPKILLSVALYIKNTGKPFYCLDDVFTPCLSDKFFLFTMGFKPPAYNCAKVMHTDQFNSFDQQSRSETGMCRPDGFATMTVYVCAGSLTTLQSLFFMCSARTFHLS